MAASTETYEMPLPEFDKSVKLLIVLSPYYKDISDDLVKGAMGTLEKAGAAFDVIHVPGALEIPTAIRIADRQSNFDGYIALGCVIRGETSHYETVCTDSSRGLLLLGLDGCCIGNGILTVETMDQAQVRADPEGQNKGAGAAAAALHLVALSRKWGHQDKEIGFQPDSILMAGDTKGSTST